MPLVLIIDDDPTIRDAIRQALAAAGYAVDEAADGRDALRAARARRPDVALCDMVMPGMEGAETIHALRAEFPATAVIAITGVARRSLSTARALGARATLRKPFHFAALREAIDRVLTESADQT